MDKKQEPIELDFPVTDYYKSHILAGHKLSHTGVWLSAILLLNDPKSKKPFIALYRWQKTKKGWKTRKRYSFKSQAQAKQAIEILQEFSTKLT
jgi:hypothetical protein